MLDDGAELMPDPARVIQEMIDFCWREDWPAIQGAVTQRGYVEVQGPALELLLREVYQIGLGRGLSSHNRWNCELGNLIRLNVR